MAINLIKESRKEPYYEVYAIMAPAVASQFTYARISHIVDVIKIREVAIKGKAKKINIYEVLRVTEQ